LTNNQTLSALPSQYLSTLPTRDKHHHQRAGGNRCQSIRQPASGTTKNGSTTAVRACWRPSRVLRVTLNSANSGGSYFHQFAARMQKPFFGCNSPSTSSIPG